MTIKNESQPIQTYLALRNYPCESAELAEAVTQFRHCKDDLVTGRAALYYGDACLELATRTQSSQLVDRLLAEADEQYEAGVARTEDHLGLCTRLEAKRAFLPSYRARLIGSNEAAQEAASNVWGGLVGLLSRTALGSLMEEGGSTLVSEIVFHSLLARRVSKGEATGIASWPSFARHSKQYNRHARSTAWNAVVTNGESEREQRLWVTADADSRGLGVTRNPSRVPRLALVGAVGARDVVSLANGIVQEGAELRYASYGRSAATQKVLTSRISLAGELLEKKVRQIARTHKP